MFQFEALNFEVYNIFVILRYILSDAFDVSKLQLLEEKNEKENIVKYIPLIKVMNKN